MKIEKIHLENFRGIKSLSLDLKGKNAAIYGANGTGKTTIANAIIWTLLDSPATGEKDFTPKTIDTHDLQHSAELTVTADDGSVYTLYKDFFEVWTKKRGAATKEFSGHRTEYKINGVPYKKGAYTKAVERICGTEMENIKKLMLEGYFLESLSVDERRHTLFDICGDVSDEAVMEAPGLEDLPSLLKVPGTDDQTYTPAEYLKMAKAQRTNLNKELQIIHARIDEAEKSIPEHLPDKESTAAKREKLVNEHDALTQKMTALTAASGKEQAVIDARAAYTKAAQAYEEKKHQQHAAVYRQLESMAADKRKLMQQRDECLDHLKKLEKEHDMLADMRADLLDQYAKVDARQWDSEQETCPTCHQKLPKDQIEKLKAEFNQTKSREKEAINARGQQCSITKIKAFEPQIIQTDEAYKMAVKNLQELIENIKTVQDSLGTIPRFEDTDEGKSLKSNIEVAEKMEDASQSNAYKDLMDKRSAVSCSIRETDMTLADISAAEKAKKRVQELTVQQEKTAVALERAEYGIHLVEEFSRKKAAMVTDKINSKFKHIQFVLFENQINGGLKEICEPTIQNPAGQWVPYKSANTAGRMNAELEIIEVLNQYYKTNLPVIMDRAESVCHPADIKQQLIRLIVSAEDKELRIELKED